MSLWHDLRRAYVEGVFDVLRRYWCAYGGARAVLLSPYFHAALLLTALLWPYWLRLPWWDVALAAMPSCRVPDDCIDPKRRALFVSRAVMRGLIEQLRSEAT